MTVTRRGASIFGLLILLAVLAILAALLLPAIQRVREAANQMTCANNLRQIGIAAHNYHSDYKKLPPGYYGPFNHPGATSLAYDPQRGPWAGCLVPLLPYVEQDNLFKNTFNTTQTYPPSTNAPLLQPIGLAIQVERAAWWTNPGNLGPTVGQVRIKMLKCPSDTVDEPVAKGVLYTVHIGGDKPTFKAIPDGPANLGRTNYTGVAGTCGRMQFGVNSVLAQWEGPLTNRSTVELGQMAVQDGTSNTLMFGEGVGGTGVGARDTAWSWFGVGAMGTYYGLGRGNLPAPAEPPTPADKGVGPTTAVGQEGAAWYRFGSRHAAVVQFCFGDCSMRGLKFGSTTTYNFTAGGEPARVGNNPSDWAVFQQLAGRKEGFNNDVSGLVD